MAHVVDLARFLNGEPASVHGFTHTFLTGREVDDAVEAAVRFENGSVGTLEATRFAHGRLTVSLQARDTSGKTSAIVHKVFFR